MTNDLDVETLMKAHLFSLVRLAHFIGLDVQELVQYDDAHYRIACTIVRWLKRNPQKKKSHFRKRAARREGTFR